MIGDPSATRAASKEELSAERARRRHVAEHAREMLVQLDRLGRSLIIHERSNNAVTHGRTLLAHQVKKLHEDGRDIAVVLAEGHPFVNGCWVRASKFVWEAAESLTLSLRDLDARGFVLERGVSPDSLLELASALQRNADERSPAEIRKHLDGLPGLGLISLRPKVDDPKATRARVLATFEEAIQAMARSEERELDLYLRRHQRRIVQEFIGLAEVNPEDLLALTMIRDIAVRESVSRLLICIYSVSLGQMLGLGRAHLLRLGIASLAHDVGQRYVEEVASRPRELTSAERRIVQQHPVHGFRHLLDHHGVSSETAIRAMVAFEHHLRWDGAPSYPFVPLDPPSPFARIVSIADTFNALTCTRPHRPAYLPDQAVKLVLRETGGRLDPTIVQAFLGLIGRYPPGSCVELDTGEIAVVVGPGEGRDPLQRPRVVVVTDEFGEELATPRLVDLGERHLERRAWRRTIARPCDPGQLGQAPIEYAFGDREEILPELLDLHDDRLKKAKKKPAGADEAAPGSPSTG